MYMLIEVGVKTGIFTFTTSERVFDNRFTLGGTSLHDDMRRKIIKMHKNRLGTIFRLDISLSFMGDKLIHYWT
jgi:hypothetical protein